MLRQLSIAVCILILATCASTSAFADITTGFEVGQTFLLRTGNNGQATQDCTFAYTGSCSAELYLPDLGADSAAAGVALDSPLATIYSSVWAYVPSSSPQLFPYLDYYVDSNQDGAIEAIPTDSLVILDQSPTFTAGTWTYEVLNGDSLVHVEGNRPGLAPTNSQRETRERSMLCSRWPSLAVELGAPSTCSGPGPKRAVGAIRVSRRTRPTLTT